MQVVRHLQVPTDPQYINRAHAERWPALIAGTKFSCFTSFTSKKTSKTDANVTSGGQR